MAMWKDCPTADRREPGKLRFWAVKEGCTCNCGAHYDEIDTVPYEVLDRVLLNIEPGDRHDRIVSGYFELPPTREYEPGEEVTITGIGLHANGDEWRHRVTAGGSFMANRTIQDFADLTKRKLEEYAADWNAGKVQQP